MASTVSPASLVNTSAVPEQEEPKQIFEQSSMRTDVPVTQASAVCEETEKPSKSKFDYDYGYFECVFELDALRKEYPKYLAEHPLTGSFQPPDEDGVEYDSDISF
eukprot:GILK01005185.1.p1 GENE.GILK01005185.1~~GILK01005185.1.p1  ORF type:complete len:105 (+),score=17.77 GILK01005185.1:147-461(+)